MDDLDKDIISFLEDNIAVNLMDSDITRKKISEHFGYLTKDRASAAYNKLKRTGEYFEIRVYNVETGRLCWALRKKDKITPQCS